MKTAQKALVLAGVTIGLLTTTTGTAMATSPVSSVAATSVAAPIDRDGNHRDRDGGHKGNNNGRDHFKWKGDRGRGDHDWNHRRGDNHRWRWDYSRHHYHYNWDWYSVSPSKCRSGGGHVDNHWCENGRYDGRWVRF